jgi:hypothetical protein
MTMNISLEQAQAMIERARTHAERIGVPMNIAVVDGGGHLIAFARMDRAIRGLGWQAPWVLEFDSNAETALHPGNACTCSIEDDLVVPAR